MRTPSINTLKQRHEHSDEGHRNAAHIDWNVSVRPSRNIWRCGFCRHYTIDAPSTYGTNRWGSYESFRAAEKAGKQA